MIVEKLKGCRRIEIAKQAINKVVSLNIVKSRQGNFVTIFTEKGFDVDDDNLRIMGCRCT